MLGRRGSTRESEPERRGEPPVTSDDAAARNSAPVVPGAVHDTIIHAVKNLQRGHATASLLAIAGMAAALWSASSYTAAFMRASNAIYDVPEGRPVWKTLPVRVGVTLVLM